MGLFRKGTVSERKVVRKAKEICLTFHSIPTFADEETAEVPSLAGEPADGLPEEPPLLALPASGELSGGVQGGNPS